MGNQTPHISPEEKRKSKRIYLLYDAPSGALSTMLDSARKMFGGVNCDLCAITHGITGKKKAWSEFEEKMDTEVVYLHEDEIEDIEKKMQKQLVLPCVLAELENGDFEVILSYLTIKNLEKPSVERFTGAMQLWADALGVVI